MFRPQTPPARHRGARGTGLRRLGLLAGAAALLMAGDRATADNILRRAGGGGATSSDAAAARAAAAAAQAAAQAAALARQAQSPLRRALDSIRTFQAAQDAARAAAQAVPGDVPDGIAVGGLEVAPGGTFQGADLLTLTTADGRSEVTLRQSDPRAILTWNTFNVGRNTDVHFDQTAGGDSAAAWVALNRVVDPSAAPSRILGSIRAEGQVYIINRNGILFAGTSQVNVGTLVASGLDILPATGQTADSRFLTGTLYDLRFAGPAGSLTIEPGARISAAGQGRVALLGGQVANGGSIEAPDGQVILAAASTVTLGVSGDLSAVRGLAAPVVSTDGTVENTGIISTPRGNITMVAADTRQDGLLTATTGAQANGSIILGVDGFATSFGGGSVTQILPDVGGVKVIGSGEGFRKSRIEVRGDKIDVLDGATIYAPSGDVLLSALMTAPDPNVPPPSGLDDTRIYVGSGARIDVSGLPDVVVPMEQNDIKAELRANELRDAPLLRDGPLRGRTVHFDARLGVKIADLSGYYDLIERDVSQLMISGGSLTLNANEIVTRQGSTIDLSGGNLRYLAGYVQSTLLIDPTGKRVPIEAALPGVPYVGIDGGFAVNHARWGVSETYASGLSRARPRFEQGYVEGGSAGSLTIGSNEPTWFVQYLNDHAADPRPPDPSATGAFRVFDGEIAATTIAGPRQRELPTGTTGPTLLWRQQPRGAALTISGAGDVTIADVGTQLPTTYHAGDPLDPGNRYRHLLPARWFDGRTFRIVSIESGYDPDSTPVAGDPGTIDRAPGGHLAVGPGVVVDLGDGGSFSFKGKGAEIDGTLLAPGGNVSIQALRTDGGAELPGLRLGATGVIDVAGRLTNDSLDGLYGPLRALGGGKVSLTGASVVLAAGSLVDVSGGARVDVTGTKSTAGNGGSIAIDVSQHPTPTPPSSQAAPFQGTLTLDGALRGYALGKGGLLSLATGYDIWIGDALRADATPTYRLLTPAFFTHGGFSSYSIVGERSVTVANGTDLAPSAEKLAFRGVSASALRTGTRLDDVLVPTVMPDEMRDPMSLGLSTIPARQTGSDASIQTSTFGNLLVGAGSTIRMTPGSTVRLGSTMDLRVQGTVEALGGNIILEEKRGIYIPAGQDVPGIHLDAGAQLLANGYLATTVVGIQKVRSVRAGGAITIASTTDVTIDPAAVLDVSGVQGIADLPSGAAIGSLGIARYQARPLDGDAGSVSISSAGGVVDGTLRLAPGGPSARGGSLVVERTASTSGPIVVKQSSPTAIAESLAVSANAIDASGADDVTLRVIGTDALDFGKYAILFDGAVNLHAGRSLTLVSPVLGTRVPSASPPTVTLSSRYVSLAGGKAHDPDSIAAGAANLGGILTVTGDLIDVSRTVLLGCATDPTGGCASGGFGIATFDARGDIRLSDDGAVEKAGLFSTGAIAFRSAQVYVASRRRSEGDANVERSPEDPGVLVQSAQRIDVIGNGNPAPVPLSFGERLTFQAPVIDQGGVVRAPQGQIFLVGTGPDGSVTLEPGSVTSASLAGLTVPFGKVGTGGVFVGYDQAGEAPTKSVHVAAPNVAVKSGAVIDVSGGGDLLGWLAVPGNGGSGDILSDSKGFAVVPSLGTAPAPIGGVDALRDSRLAVGEAIFLQGVPGLADGYYTLLPAHYALLPGGLLVQPLGGSFVSAPATSVRPDGTVIASGHGTLSGTPGFSRYLVMSHEVFGRYSRIDTYSFNPYAEDLAGQAGVGVRTPIDAGAVVLDATQTLLLQGTGRFGASQGRLGDLDLSAPKLAVVGAGEAAPDASYLTLDPHALEAFGAGSVLLGGTRTRSASGTAIAVRATDVYVSTDAASPLRAPELILAALGSVSIADGSVVRAEGVAPVDANPLLLSGDGALVRLSTGGRVPIVRTGATPTGGTPCTVGCLAIGSASLAVDGSLSLDGSQSIALSPAATLSARQFDLASARVNLGDAPANAPGVTLGADKLAELAAASDLLIRGHDSIDVYGSLLLGGRNGSGAATLRALTLDTGLLQGHLDAGDAARITAADLTLRNCGGGVQGATGAGSLVLDVDALLLGPGQVQLAGFGALTGSAGVVETRGAGGLGFAGNVSLATAQLRAGVGSRYTVQVGGDLALARGAAAVLPAPATVLGGRIDVVASSVLLNTSVVLPAGVFQATATSGGLQLGQNATLDVRGAAVDFHGQARYAPGGAIRLTASGHVDVAAGASLDVSGSDRGGDAGAIELIAGDRASVLGDLRGVAASGFRGGAFALDAGNVASTADLAALNARLEAGGFDASREIRLRQQGQDVVLAAGDRIRAHEVVLRSDGGQVRVAGEIVAAGTASRPDGGRIHLEGGGGVTIDGTARLDAHAGDAPAGGFDPSSAKVEVVADGGRVDVAPGAVVDVGGGRSGGGSVVVRAPRDGNDVAVDRLAADIRGAREVIVQGVRTYSAGVVDSTLVAGMLTDADAWMTNAGGIQARLAGQGAPASLIVAPGVVVTSGGDLSIQSTISLASPSGTRGPGYLGFLAENGNILVQAVVSDGFDAAIRDASSRLGGNLLPGRSFSYGFESGGDIEVFANAAIRTGTGDISIRAGHDLKLDDPTSVIYTAGARTATPATFLGAPAGMPLGEFPTGGGDVEIVAGHDIRAPFTAQTTSAWLFRYGATAWNGDAASSTVSQQTSWSVVYPNFEQAVGALGGGDVRVRAANDVVQLQVSIPTTGFLTTAPNAVPVAGDLVVRGGGDIDLAAGGDIRGGLFTLGRGRAELRADGSVLPSDTLRSLRTLPVTASLGTPRNVGVLFGLMDATAQVTARSAVYVEGAYDPMRQGQIAANLAGGTGSAFWGYSERAALEVTSVAGTVAFENDPWASADVSLDAGAKAANLVRMSGSGDNALNIIFSRAPPSLRLTSLQSSVSVEDHFGHSSALNLAPAARGNLELLAGQDVRLALATIGMDDVASSYARGPLDPFATNGGIAVLGAASDASSNFQRGLLPAHAGDPDPVRVYALAGSVCGLRSGACTRDPSQSFTRVIVPKPIEVIAGQDVVAGLYQPQNNGPNDVSIVMAGRDLFQPVLEVMGAGTLVLQAGRDVVLNQPTIAGSLQGGVIYGLGNRTDLTRNNVNQALPDGKGADLYILAGMANGVDYDAFAAAYLDPAHGHRVVRTYLPELAAYMRGLGYGPLSDSDLVAAFQALPPVRRAIFLDQVYFAELKATGIDYNDPSSPRHRSYDRGFSAISLLFPTDPHALTTAQRGNVILSGRAVETQADAGITILAPYGSVDVGADGIADAAAAKGGVVTRRGGDIRIMSDEDIALFTSRVFTLQGGDITMWTSDGSITAGAASKTSVFQKPLVYTMDAAAVVAVDSFGLQTGGGIGVLDALQNSGDRPRSRLDLIAPRGEVNAGDAGIRVVGDLNIAAAVVVGMENIQVSGASAGVPKVEAPNVGALTTASQVAQAAAKEGVGPDQAAAKNVAADLPSIITVEVVGYETTDKDDGRSDERRKKAPPSKR